MRHLLWQRLGAVPVVATLRGLLLPVLPVLPVLPGHGLLPGLGHGLLPGLLRRLLFRPPGLPPRLPTRRSHLLFRDSWYPGLTSVGGQHDAFVRVTNSGKLLFVTLSAMRHRDSYVWRVEQPNVGSRYRLAQPLRTHV
ncbi:hypothetical protein ACIHCQ_22575 [Streptomyces sp. NPDC052236]|uniref:hypothetical protein n=1 Tax=Streptomyces sp. NPDC052236 TaxID=3365686 RepID=UPI0037D5B166